MYSKNSQQLARLLAAIGLLQLVLPSGASVSTIWSGNNANTMEINEKVDLDSICSDQQVSLSKISVARKLIDELRSSSGESTHAECAKFKDSFEQLDVILARTQTGRVCDLSFVNLIRDFHLTFISNANNEAHENIPKSLRYFFISLCFQISAECKKTLIMNLEYDTKEKISESDYEEVKFLEAYGATLLDSGTEINDFDDILLLDDLHAAAADESQQGAQDELLAEAGGAQGESGRLLIKVKTNSMMRKLVANCNNKFKPFYDKLIMPLIKLSNLGYNYQGELLERELLELKHNPLVRRWYNIVQTCEAFRTIQVYEDPDVEQLGSGRQAITFISGEEVVSLRERHVKSIEEEIEGEESIYGKAIEYDPEPVGNVDELWIKDQQELNKLVVKYKANSSEADRVRSKLFKKLIAKMKESIMSGKVLMFASDLVKSSFQRAGDTTSRTSVNEDIIMMMDEAVENDELVMGEAPLEAYDSAVAGGTKRSVLKSGRKVVSRAGPTAPKINTIGFPDKIKNIKVKRDGTKTTTKLMNWGRALLPRRMDIFMWLLAICGFLMLVMAIFSG